MRRRYGVSVLAIMAVLIAACGDDDTSAPPQAEDAEIATQPAEDSDATGETGTDGDAAEPPLTNLTAQDGFNGPLDADADADPGTGTIRFDDEVIELTVECVELTRQDTTSASSDIRFSLMAEAHGMDAAGNAVEVSAMRYLIERPDVQGLQERGELHVYRSVDGDPERHWSFAQSGYGVMERVPGEGLPIVRVLEDGSFSATAELTALPQYDRAFTGVPMLTGRCQEGWGGPIADAA